MKHQDEKQQLRRFGLTVGGIFAVIGFWPLVFRGQAPRVWALVPGVVLVLGGLVLPRSLAHIHRAWMAMAEGMAWINTRILLSVVFYGLVTPMGFIMRRFGQDPMRRRFEPSVGTYRVPKASRPAAHMTRQF
jgi:Saxitoxin biosynthesis operon protein SxtJ